MSQKEQVQKGTIPCWSYAKVQGALDLVGTTVLDCQTTQKAPECVSVKCSNLLKCRFALLKTYSIWFRFVSFWMTLLIWKNLDENTIALLWRRNPLGWKFLRKFLAVIFCIIQFLCCLLESEWTLRCDLESGLDGSWCFLTLLCVVFTSGLIPIKGDWFPHTRFPMVVNYHNTC